MVRPSIPTFLLLSLTLSAESSARTIAPDELVDFQVNAWADVGNGPYSTHVAAWMDTGLWLEAGDIFALTATGNAAESPAGASAGGRTPDGDGGDCDANCLVGLPQSRYALVGKIGTDLGDEFLVGSGFSDIANDTGYLYLAFNDSHYRDNAGSYLVSTAPVPEPSTAALLAVGVTLLLLRRRAV